MLYHLKMNLLNSILPLVESKRTHYRLERTLRMTVMSMLLLVWARGRCLRLDHNNGTAYLSLALMVLRQRRFGFMSMLSFSCTVLVTWEGVLVLVSHIARENATVAHSVLSLFAEGFTK